MPMALKKKGDLVQYWFDTGALGYRICYAIVEKAGPVTYTIRSESGSRNRVRQDYSEVKWITDPELLEEARAKLAPKEPHVTKLIVTARNVTGRTDESVRDELRSLLKRADLNLDLQVEIA